MASLFRCAVVQAYSWTLHLLRQPIYALRHCNVAWTSRVERGAVLVHTIVGAYTYIAAGVFLNRTQIGNYCSIASGSKIGGMEHPWRSGSTSTRLSRHHIAERETLIEDDVWVGSNVVIRQGLHIERGAVIGAGSVVLENVPPYTIVAGVPAREIRKRFSAEIIQQIAVTKFWEYPPDKARSLLETIEFPNVQVRQINTRIEL
jgi:acetyltransferase-like isoleucine patch superfamily enzyme